LTIRNLSGDIHLLRTDLPACPYQRTNRVRNAARFLTTDKKLLKGAADAVSALVGAGGKVSSETVETMARNIRQDMQGLPKSLYEVYGRKVEGALQDLVKALQRVVESMGPTRGDGKSGVEAEMFVGRVAIYLAKQAISAHSRFQTQNSLSWTFASPIKSSRKLDCLAR
jgi:hypothetical protein